MVINTANYVYFLALERAHGLGNAGAMDVFVSELLRLHRGQGQDILWRDSGTCPSEDEYTAMVLDSALQGGRCGWPFHITRVSAQRRAACFASRSA